jgi:hypothetical protein
MYWNQSCGSKQTDSMNKGVYWRKEEGMSMGDHSSAIER